MSDETEPLWLAVIELTQMLMALGDVVLAEKPDTLKYRRKRNQHLGAINQLLQQHAKVRDMDLPSSADLHNRLLELEESESQRRADKDRPVHVTIVREPSDA